MAEVSMQDVSAVIATADKRTAAKAKNLFKNVREISTFSHLKRVFEDARTRQVGEVAEGKYRHYVVLFDLDMPHANTEDALLKLRETISDAVTVVLTSSSEEALRALRAGAEDYVMKPIRVEDLRTRIQRVLEQHSREWQRIDMPKMDAPLPHLVEKLHDSENGQLDAKEISNFFGLSVADLARIIGRGISTVHKTPSSPALQESLHPFEAMASGLLRLAGSERRARMWLHAPNPALDGHAPMEWLRTGKVVDLAAFIQDLLEGRPA